LESQMVEPALIRKVPISFARRYRLLPIRLEDGRILVAMTNPLDLSPLDDLRLLLGSDVKAALTSTKALLRCLNQVYDQAVAATAEQAIEDLSTGDNLDRLAGELDEPQDLLDATDEAPIIRLVNSVLFQAVKQRASDIHFESFERGW